MAQVALFVDAGYLLAGAHDLLGGTVSRSAFDCNFESLCKALRSEVESHSGAGLTFLRTYWYDGARDGIPTADHRRVGDLAYVKVRLGRLNRRGQQKGVDGLIYRDLTALARVGAVRRAYLFTGDEDIRESVVAAQDLGVQVVLITFKPTAQTGRSAALTREVDEVVVLDHMFWQPHFTKRTTAAVTLGPPSETDLRACAAPFAAEWTKGATASEVTAYSIRHRASRRIYTFSCFSPRRRRSARFVVTQSRKGFSGASFGMRSNARPGNGEEHLWESMTRRSVLRTRSRTRTAP